MIIGMTATLHSAKLTMHNLDANLTAVLATRSSTVWAAGVAEVSMAV